jgi:SAM-dependent methyltransferase
VSVIEKFDRLAAGYREHDYADPERYAARRAQLIVELEPQLEPGESVLDLCCGDGMMAPPLTALGLRYLGVDASEGMIEAAKARNPDVPFALGRYEDYRPPDPVDYTIFLRTMYLVQDHRALFDLVRSYTRRSFILDFRPGADGVSSVVDDLRKAGFRELELRPFFLPQRRHVPAPLLPAVYGLERTGAPARLVLRRYGRVLCAARV